MEDRVRIFLSLSSGRGSGDGSGDGNGNGNGNGTGYGTGDGSGDGYGRGSGSGYGNGPGSGYGNGDGSGFGRGSGRGYGFGDGRGYGFGWGFGDGDGSGSGIKLFNGEAVYGIDGVQTILRRIRGESVARGCMLNGDLTLTPCYVVKQNGKFAHGETLREAREALLEKLFDDMPEEERLQAFVQAHSADRRYPNADFFAWHHRLTGSCEMGRRQFAKDHSIDVEGGSMTPEDFIRLTENAYGCRTIRKLRPLYGMKE